MKVLYLFVLTLTYEHCKQHQKNLKTGERNVGILQIRRQSIPAGRCAGGARQGFY